MSGFMRFVEGDVVVKRCSNCNDTQVVQQTLDSGCLCKKCWDRWMGEPTGVVLIAKKCEECGREGVTPVYSLRKGGTRACCSACFVKEFGELPVMAEEIENIHGEVELLPHSPHKVRP